MKKAKISALMLSGCMTCSLFMGCTSRNSTPSDPKDMTSQQVVEDMRIGWNLGDTLDVCAADRDGDGRVNEAPAEGEAVDETLWGNPMATQELFTALKEDGVNAVRIPVTWRDHVSEDGSWSIDGAWMSRVQEVVDYALSEDMYVIINLHHDGGGDPQFGAWIRTDYDGFAAVQERFAAMWEQIAEHFKDYDHHLIFESMNEVGFDRTSEELAYTMLNILNQSFVDTVRSSGGNNATRHLLIAGYWTDIQATCNDRYEMPEDPASRCILSVHYYTPYEFCIAQQQSAWGSQTDIRKMENLFGRMKEQYVDKGVPVIVGEYGVTADREAESRIFFYEMVVKTCRDAGMAAFLWDNGSEFDRTTYEWKTDGVIEALQRASGDEDYTPVK
ncbi:MAG: glycoside hydrolase family 5 protein [Ruminococcus sp.]